MVGTPFIIGPQEEAELRTLRDLAATKPVDMRGLLDRLKKARHKARHMHQMADQTVYLPFGWSVTFSIETGHPGGAARHMSMASPDPGRVPRPEAVWMVAEVLGFTGSIEQCTVWPEQLMQGMAINVVQILTSAEGSA